MNIFIKVYYIQRDRDRLDIDIGIEIGIGIGKDDVYYRCVYGQNMISYVYISIDTVPLKQRTALHLSLPLHIHMKVYIIDIK